MTVIPASLASLLYLAAGLTLGRRLLRGAAAAELSRRLPLGLAGAALLLHAYLLLTSLHAPDGLRLGLFNAASLVAGAVALVLVLAALRKPVENLGIAIFPLAALLVITAALSPASQTVVQAPSLGLELHILSSIVAYSLLTIAAVQAVLLAVQDRHLRNHHPGGIIRALPPLRTMETLLFEMIGAGFALLSVSLLSGLLYLEDIFAQHLIHKTVLSLAAWVVFAVLLWGRWRLGWRGKVAIRWTLTGFATLMLAYFGSKFVLEL
ncbi:MAG TPA: cytochrome c biogenesis protein CcsA, partial [Gammaproteobacteria bacterium]